MAEKAASAAWVALTVLLASGPAAAEQAVASLDEDFLLFLADWDELLSNAEALAAETGSDGPAARGRDNEESDDHE